jgi:protease YdgD
MMSVRRRHLALLLLLALADGMAPARAAVPGAPALPGVGPDDPRAAVDVARPPWRALGRLQTEQGSRCTGFLIGPSTVVTAAHCLFDRRTRHYARPSSVHFLAGYAFGAYAGHALVRSFSIGPGYDPARELETAGADWAVVTLATSVGEPDRLLALDRHVLETGHPVILGGYGQDRAEVIVADLACTVTGSQKDPQGRPLILHSCSGTRGASGAPLLVRSADGGSWTVAGIQILARLGHGEGIAIPVADLNLAAAKPPPDGASN